MKGQEIQHFVVMLVFQQCILSSFVQIISYILAKYELLFFLDSCWESDAQEPTNIVPILGVRKERPWYHGFSDQTFYPRTCVDTSDRVFEVGQHCPSNDRGFINYAKRFN